MFIDFDITMAISQNQSDKNFYIPKGYNVKLLRRLEAVFLDSGWKFWNYNLAYKINFDLLHTASSFQHMIKVNFLIGFQATAITIATEAQSLSF